MNFDVSAMIASQRATRTLATSDTRTPYPRYSGSSAIFKQRKLKHAECKLHIPRAACAGIVIKLHDGAICRRCGGPTHFQTQRQKQIESRLASCLPRFSHRYSYFPLEIRAAAASARAGMRSGDQPDHRAPGQAYVPQPPVLREGAHDDHHL